MKLALVGFFNRHLIPNWQTEWRRLWSIRIAILWAIIGGLVALAPLVSDEAKAVVGPWAFALIFFCSFVSVTVARYLKQPGTDQ